jgi:hypothetical protein
LARHTITGSGGSPSKSPRSFHKYLSCHPPPPWSFPAVPDTPLDLRKASPQDRQSAGASRDPDIQTFKSSSLAPSSPQSSLHSKLALIEAVCALPSAVCIFPCMDLLDANAHTVGICVPFRAGSITCVAHALPFFLHPRAASPQTPLMSVEYTHP